MNIETRANVLSQANGKRALSGPVSSPRKVPSQAKNLCADWTEAVGRVPIVRLNNVASIFASRNCYLKLESCNPGGSIKEKNAVWLVKDAERSGKLLPGGTIIESSSGNFGLALAMMGAVRGYRVIIVVDQKATPTARRMLRVHGAELFEITPEMIAEHGTRHLARIAKATELSLTISGAWYPCQHYNPSNPSAHSDYTAEEIIEAFPDGLEALIVGVSTGGQLSGLARSLLPRISNLKIIAVDVQGSQIFTDEPGTYQMTGLGLSFRPPNLDYGSVHSSYIVPERLAYSTCHALTRREGLFMGASTGAIVAAGIHAAKSLPPSARICLMGPDRGDRYLETLYDPEWLERNGFYLTEVSELEGDIERTLEPFRPL